MDLNKTPEKKETIKIVYDDFQFRLDLTVKQKKKQSKFDMELDEGNLFYFPAFKILMQVG